jgi:hypothetical protein
MKLMKIVCTVFVFIPILNDCEREREEGLREREREKEKRD